MRLLLIIPKVVSYSSFLRELCLSLVAEGAEVHVACSREKIWGEEDSHAQDGVQMHAIEFPRGMNPAAHYRAAQALNRLVLKLQPDIVHTHFSAAIFATALALNPRWPVTFATFHGVAFLAMGGWKARLLRFAEVWAARRFDTVWVLTDDDCEGLSRAAHGAAVRRLPGFGVGCDVERFTPIGVRAREARRSELGVSTGQVVFAFVGRFTDFKGFGQVARAFLRLAEQESNVRLLLVGSRDPLHPTGLSPTEEDALRSSPQVINAGFCLDVESYLVAADVMVFPSRREGMPVCLMEALALGVPVITTNSRGCRDVVRHEVDGLVLSDAGIESLCAAMQLVARDEALRRRWTACALASCARFSREHFIRVQKEIYQPRTASPVATAAIAA
jgi:glycosyltransferase involved in cell wall biosynthesis